MTGFKSALIHFVTVLIIYAVIRLCILAALKEDDTNTKRQIINREQTHYVIRHYKVCLYVGVPFTLFCLSGAILSFFTDRIAFINDLKKNESIVSSCVFLIMSSIGIYLICSYMFFKVDVYKDRDFFTYRSLTTKSHVVNYSDCLYFTREKDVIRIVTEKRTYRVGNMLINHEELLYQLRTHHVKEAARQRKEPGKIRALLNRIRLLCDPLSKRLRAVYKRLRWAFQKWMRD